MRHQYITHYEIWKDGQVVGYGNQAFFVESPYAPDASSVYDEIRSDAAKRGDCDVSQIRIIGVFKL